MTSEEKRLEVRTSWKARVLGTAAGWLIRVWSWTVRIEADDRCGYLRRDPDDHPLIWCVWHSRLMALALAQARLFPWQGGAALTSASHDGAVVAAAFKVLGVTAVRGSTSRRGTAALKALVRCVRAGQDVGVTPDGPRGPRYEVGGGIIKLAQLTRARVMCFHVRFGPAIRLKTWDRFVIPLPFSKIKITFAEFLEVPRELDDDALETLRGELEKRMREGVDDLELPTHDHSRRKENRR